MCIWAMPSHLLVESILLLLLPLKREYLCTTLLSKNVFKNFVLGILLLNFIFFHSLPWLRDNSQNSLGSVFDVKQFCLWFSKYLDICLFSAEIFYLCSQNVKYLSWKRLYMKHEKNAYKFFYITFVIGLDILVDGFLSRHEK